MSSKESWTCDGKIKNPQYQGSAKGQEHEPFTNYGEFCIECGLPKEAVVVAGVAPSGTNTTTTGEKRQFKWILLLIPFLLAFIGIAAYPSVIKPWIDDVRARNGSGTPVDKCDLPKPKENPEFYSTGDRTLFPGQSNLDKSRGITAFQEKNYQQAAKYFEQAKEAARNDPESLIYKNNAKARARESPECPLTLALVVPITEKGTSAEEMMRGVADAQEQYNKNSQQGDRLLQILLVNDGNKPELAEQAAQYIAKNQTILGVIGHNASNATEAALPAYEAKNIPVISPTSTSTYLENPVFFRTVPSDAETAKVIVNYAQDELNSNKVTVFYDESSSYSRSLLKELQTILSSDRIATTVDLNQPDLTLDKLIEKVKKSTSNGVDTAILFPGTKSTSVAIRVAKANKIQQSNQMQLLGGDALYNPDTLINGGNAVENMVVAVPVVSSSSYKCMAKHWGGRVNWRTSASFDATIAFTQSITELSLSQDNITRENILYQLPLITVSSPSITVSSDNKSCQEKESGQEESWKFVDRERNTEPYLAQATKRSKEVPAPKDAEFGFKYLEKLKLLW